MDIIQSTLLRYYKENSWSCGDTYESLEWNDIITPKPSKEHLENLWIHLSKEMMREERNQLLKESDYTALIDFPTSNKQAWLDYRQQLRDFPSVWSVGFPFPSSPFS
jgi:DNA-dependent RNA polymerase auxiliary subunit epsilon